MLFQRDPRFGLEDREHGVNGQETVQGDVLLIAQRARLCLLEREAKFACSPGEKSSESTVRVLHREPAALRFYDSFENAGLCNHDSPL